MKLIGDIINELVDINISITTPLLKTKVLASRLKNEELLTWVNNELNGYTNKDTIPYYRKCTADIKGTFINGRMQFNNQPIPVIGFSDELRDAIYLMNFDQSIATIESYITKDKSGQVVYSFPAEVAGYIEAKIIEQGNPYFSIVSAGKYVSITKATDILAIIRSKLLDFMLKLEDEFGSVTDIEVLKINNEKISTIMNQTIITGDGNVLNTGDSASITATISINKGDKTALESLLKKNNVEEKDINDLLTVIDLEQPDIVKKTFGTQVNGWMKKMLGKALDGSWQMGVETAAILLAEGIKKYYGI